MSETFEDLTSGDRFLFEDHLWTKIGVDVARKHGLESMKLRDRGYGYIGDSICSFEPDNAVAFVPPWYNVGLNS